MSNTISRSPSPINTPIDQSAPNNPPEEQPIPHSPVASHAGPSEVTDTSRQAKRQKLNADSEKGRAVAEKALANMQAQQKAAANSLGLENINNTDEGTIVSAAAMERTRNLVMQGPIDVSQLNNSPEPGNTPTGLTEFDRERAIATQNSNSVRPYIIEALSRLQKLDSPPKTQKDSNELREQLELYMAAPESYNIQKSDGKLAVLPEQTFRAYSDALSPDVLRGYNIPGLGATVPQQTRQLTVNNLVGLATAPGARGALDGLL